MYQLVSRPRESDIAIHRGSPHPHRPSVNGSRLDLPWYEARNSGQAGAGRPGSAWGPVWPAGLRQVELAGLVFAGTKQHWLMGVIPSAERAPLGPVEVSWVGLEAREAALPKREGRSAATATPACAGDLPSATRPNTFRRRVQTASEKDTYPTLWQRAYARHRY